MERGRPSDYTDVLADKICDRVAKGESLRDIALDDAMPSRVTLYKWLIDDRKPYFISQYERAVDIRAENKFDEIERIAEDESRDVQRARLMIDTRKWYLSKIMPKKYGERQALDAQEVAEVAISISEAIAAKNKLKVD